KTAQPHPIVNTVAIGRLRNSGEAGKIHLHPGGHEFKAAEGQRLSADRVASLQYPEGSAFERDFNRVDSCPFVVQRNCPGTELSNCSSEFASIRGFSSVGIPSR